MNTKKIMGAVCAIACVTNLSMATPAQAFGTPSVAQQEAWARESIKKTYYTDWPSSNSDFAKTVTPIIHSLQRRVCDANGIEITTQPYKNSDDYQNKIHPMIIAEDSSKGLAVGAGYIFIGENSPYLNGLSKNNQYSYLEIEFTIAHEIAHNTKGCFRTMFQHGTNEKQADEDAIKYLENLPEGGWGIFLLHRKGYDASSVYGKNTLSFARSFEKETNGKITIDSGVGSVDYHKGNDWYRLTTVTRDLSRAEDANAYYGGQMAYCIAKKALTVDNIDIIPNNLKDTLKFQGDYLLVCRSNRFPNGYRILAPLYGTEETLKETMKIFANSDYVNIKNFKEAAKKTSQEGNDVYTNSIWTMWVTYAVAKDLAQ